MTDEGRLGRYQLMRRIGSGGMAEIWKARVQGPAGFEKFVAIKQILQQYAEDRQFVDMFVREAQIVAQLQHPNIVQVLDFGEAEGEGIDDVGYFIVMEYVPGKDLGTLLRRLKKAQRKLPVEVSCYVTLMCARGLGHAHMATNAAGQPLLIVHRDVSPSNILLSYQGDVKLADFGIAKVTSALSKTTIGVLKGKLPYMSPEQRSMSPVDGRSDIHALGLCLYEFLTNKRLFAAESNKEILKKARAFQGLTPEHLQGIPGDIAPILERMLRVEPKERYQSALDVETELASILDTYGMTEARGALSAIMREVFDTGWAQERSEDTDGSGALAFDAEADAEQEPSIILVTDMVRDALDETGPPSFDPLASETKRHKPGESASKDASKPDETGRYVIVRKKRGDDSG